MGYIGNALASLVANAGFNTIGFVRKTEKAEKINREKNIRLKATTDTKLLKTCDIILVCVQTPIHADKTPNLRFLEKAVLRASQSLRKGQLIIIESSVPVGTTRNVILPILQKSSLNKAGVDFFLAYSPERVDPGNKKFKLADIPKVVAGLDKNSKDLAITFYKQIIKKVIVVSTLETAEMVKLFENTFRLVNISMVNELADYTKNLGIDIWEVVKASSTKPFGFLAHYPGPGVGGDCIPVVPYYILNDAKKRGIKLRLIKQAGKINDKQPLKVVKRTLEILNSTNGRKNKVLLLGVSYKPEVSDTRESPALRIWNILKRNGISVSYHDPYVPKVNGATSKRLSKETIGQHDMIIILTDHNSIKYSKFLNLKKPILDTRNVFKNRHPNVFHI
jgi:UDP-N-acetyl-D-glucosamine dehydrogenase